MSSIRQFTRVAVRLGVVVATVALAAAFAPVGAQQAGQGLVAAGPSPDLFLCSTGDVIGYLDPCG